MLCYTCQHWHTHFHTHSLSLSHTHTHKIVGLERRQKLIKASYKRTLLSRVQSWDSSTLTSEHKYFNIYKRATTEELQTSILSSCSWTFMPVLHFLFVCPGWRRTVVCVSCLLVVSAVSGCWRTRLNWCDPIGLWGRVWGSSWCHHIHMIRPEYKQHFKHATKKGNTHTCHWELQSVGGPSVGYCLH